MADLENALQVLRGGAIEGRFENVRWRQDQFHALHEALREKSDAICEAIVRDSNCSMAEAEAELYLTMDAVQKSYDLLNFEKSLEQEYIVTKGKNNTGRRIGVGLVGIRPQRHSRFHSVVSAVIAALAAGNSILIELDMSFPALDALLQNVLYPVMDRDTFYITSTKLNTKHITSLDLFVDQTLTGASSFHSTKETRTLAILDRTGSVETAAKAITIARLGLYSTSPYAPDLIIVNEYMGHSFGLACLQHASNNSRSTKIRNVTAEEKQLQKTLQEAEEKGQVKIHRAPGTDLAVVELLSSTSPLAKTKIVGPYILTLPSTGLVDSVTTSRSSPTFLATYLFASPASAKYLSEQIPSHASYINQVPPQLLIGPPSPTSQPHALHPRYTPEMFSTPRPQFIVEPAKLPSSMEMKKLAAKELKPTGQPAGKAIGFFEQGILIGLGTTAIIVLPAVGWGLYWVGRKGFSVLRGLR